jgi:hypothetical protein
MVKRAMQQGSCVPGRLPNLRVRLVALNISPSPLRRQYALARF